MISWPPPRESRRNTLKPSSRAPMSLYWVAQVLSPRKTKVRFSIMYLLVRYSAQSFPRWTGLTAINRNGGDRPGWNLGGECSYTIHIYFMIMDDIDTCCLQLVILIWSGILAQPLMLFSAHPVSTYATSPNITTPWF